MSKHCDICSLDFMDDYALQGHLAGKRHMKKLQYVEVMERSIVVSPLPKFIPPHGLVDFFQQYGEIKWHKLGPNYLTIEFCDRNITETLLTKPVWINNVKLNIKKRIPHRVVGKPKAVKQNGPMENTGVISYDNIKHIFEENTSFDDQLAAFLDAVQLTDDEIESRYGSICTQLDKIFKVIFPKCKTYKFGSTQTGLGFKECDLDIYMDIGEPIHDTNNAPSDVWTTQKIFREVKRVMYRMNCVFSDIVSIPKAKTPIIKFRYVRTNVSCDISFKNSLGIYKSNWIKHCISLDNRVKPLMMIIKYWARNFKISGSGKMSNYGLMLLIIFYLQQPSVKIIPPLMELQRTCQPQIVNGWQVNFDENLVLPPTTNKSSIPQLLNGFFIFYSTFEFKSNVICPIDGMIHTDSEFENIDSLPQCMDRYKACVKEDESLKFSINKPMCVQDPIELTHNTTSSTHLCRLEYFVQCCAFSAEIFTMTSKNDYKDLMKILFTMVLKRKSTFEISISANHFRHVKEPSSSQIGIDIINKAKLAKNDWYFTVFNIVKDIFEKVFKVEVEVLTADVEAKQQKIEVLSDVHTEKHQKIIFHCTGSYCVWRNRKINNIVLDPSLSCLQKEAFMSDQTIESWGKQKSANKTNLDFMCTFEKKTRPLRVILTITNQNCYEYIFQEFTRFARQTIVKITEKTLIYMQQFDKCY
ncbi:speckle targeted PIP5K1A-regulated poly(A) polymerase [Calliopsis andreniformis]|uniref:speckle targeted PIP5K1A-regulated poly(A) polymerase n=1 Tax=Calliopsis andreniformis TaxID=337506 RepID=UPI003FCD2F29